MVERVSYIVTFKTKNERADKESDKVEIFRSAIKSPVNVIEAASALRLPAHVPAENIALDINEYEAPIVTAKLTDDDVAALKKDPNVAAVEPDGKCYALPAVECQPSPEVETIPWGIDRIKAPQAWDITKGKGMKVAVCDTGVDYTHPDFSPNYRGGISFVPAETDPKDFNGHGTHVAGTIIGVAPSAYLYAVKVLGSDGSGNFSWIIAGIDWCVRNGMHVLNMSLGAPSAPTTALERMCNLAWSRGLILVAAAGNDRGPVNFPARYQSVIAVSAIDSANVIAEFSSRGPEVELCAPGVDVLSTLPGDRYGTLSGTSMACPHVAGVATLALSSHRWAPSDVAKNVAIRRLLASTAENLGIPGRDEEYGFGRVNADEAAFRLEVPSAVSGLP
ncbi:subtilisin-like serine protease [Candidatus Methanoperedens nitroreducens]|uniref:Subtilisin-like serine protease n=1 Tax=Candidatus Methanoperedens nitratireducens TaxID=1392998 RepID=A0A062VA58_9EURY|nr:S8 family peptidase [Candidatus Methanoperedens nitroreducens]KCZ73388.1 subtilisin-like serine protease [Candidatus Methanoperedens nitroreducens]MDJ1422658.1 S8 family serine peptidase [Candidatus Methanoperedens sp.]